MISPDITTIGLYSSIQNRRRRKNYKHCLFFFVSHKSFIVKLAKKTYTILWYIAHTIYNTIYHIMLHIHPYRTHISHTSPSSHLQHIKVIHVSFAQRISECQRVRILTHLSAAQRKPTGHNTGWQKLRTQWRSPPSLLSSSSASSFQSITLDFIYHQHLLS